MTGSSQFGPAAIQEFARRSFRLRPAPILQNVFRPSDGERCSEVTALDCWPLASIRVNKWQGGLTFRLPEHKRYRSLHTTALFAIFNHSHRNPELRLPADSVARMAQVLHFQHATLGSIHGRSLLYWQTFGDTQ